MKKLLLLLALTMPAYAKNYVLCSFTGPLGGATPDTFRMATSTDGATWTNKLASWSNPTNNVNAPTCINIAGKWYAHVAAANGQVVHLRNWYVGTLDYPSGTVTTTVNIDWLSKIPGLDTCFAGEWFAEGTFPVTDYTKIHLFIPCTTDSSYASSWVTYETHPTASDLSTWSDPVAITITGTHSNLLYDSTVIKISSNKYVMLVTDLNGTSTANFVQQVEMATATNFLGPYTLITSGDWAGWRSTLGAHEGPNVYKLANGNWRIMIEKLSSSQMYYADCAQADFSTCTWGSLNPWTEDMLYRHGTVTELYQVTKTAGIKAAGFKLK